MNRRLFELRTLLPGNDPVSRGAGDTLTGVFHGMSCRFVRSEVRCTSGLQYGATLVLASHNMSEVERLCDDVLMLRAGRLVDRGTPDELLRRYGRKNMEEVFIDIARERRIALGLEEGGAVS